MLENVNGQDVTSITARTVSRLQATRQIRSTDMEYVTYVYKGYEFPRSERSYRSVCGKPRQIEDDDLAEVYSPSDCCLCHLSRAYA